MPDTDERVRTWMHELRGPRLDEVLRIRSSVLAGMGELSEPERRPSRRRRATPRLVLTVAAVVVTALAVSVAVLAGRGADQTPAVVALDATARAAAAQAYTPLQPGQFLYTKVVGMSQLILSGGVVPLDVSGAPILGATATEINQALREGRVQRSPTPETFTVLHETTNEMWVNLDGSSRVQSVGCCPRLATPRDEAVWDSSGRPDLDSFIREIAQDFAPGDGPTVGDLTLSADPDVIGHRFGGADGKLDLEEVGDHISSLLYAAPEVRAALLEAIARIPGLEVIEHARDGVGRRGTGFATVQAGVEQMVVFDSSTGQYLGSRRVSVGTDRYPKGTVLSWSAVLEVAPVAEVGATPNR